jgi:type IV fimbrial biogenesis protein FimT
VDRRFWHLHLLGDQQGRHVLIRAASERGFSLIELMVTVVIMVILSLLAVPSMREYAENSKILGTAEAFYASAQTTRTEAIRRNGPVELILTNQAPVAGSADTTGITSSGPNWMIRQVPPTTDDEYVFIEGKAGGEGGGRTGGTTSVVIGASNAGAIQFSALGALAGTTAVTVDFSSSLGTCAPSGAVRCLRVVIAPGGQARLCDPAVTTASDTRRC